MAGSRPCCDQGERRGRERSRLSDRRPPRKTASPPGEESRGPSRRPEHPGGGGPRAGRLRRDDCSDTLPVGSRRRHAHSSWMLSTSRGESEAARGASGRLRSSRAPARAPRRRHREPHRASPGLPRLGAVVGRGNRRHALRALPRARRAPQRVREGRRLRGRLEAHPLDARHLAAHPVGQAGQRGRAALVRADARALHRLHELQHVPGPGGPEARPTSSAA